MDITGINSNGYGAQNAQNSAQKAKGDEFERKLKAAMDSQDEAQLKKVSKDIESMFVNMMLKEMRKSISKSGITESAPGKDVFESMFDEKIAEEISKGKGLGLGDMIFKQVSRDMKNKVKTEE